VGSALSEVLSNWGRNEAEMLNVLSTRGLTVLLWVLYGIAGAKSVMLTSPRPKCAG
jgi:hypothetical protein